MENEIEAAATPESGPQVSTPAKSVRPLVNEVAVRNCFLDCEGISVAVLDLSFLRVIVDNHERWAEFEGRKSFPVVLRLDRTVLSASATLQRRAEAWARLSFDNIVPSARAHLRSFLSPKRVGESIVEDWRADQVRHYHGLNESELSVDGAGDVYFGYLDALDPTYQFVVHVPGTAQPLRVGRIPRKEYIELSNLNAYLVEAPTADRDTFSKLGECRDVVTNFRPTGQVEYNLKQRLLKVLSDYLYSTGRRVEFSPPRPPRTVVMSVENNP